MNIPPKFIGNESKDGGRQPCDQRHGILRVKDIGTPYTGRYHCEASIRDSAETMHKVKYDPEPNIIQSDTGKSTLVSTITYD